MANGKLGVMPLRRKTRRDSQRGKLYAAERTHSMWVEPTMSWEDAQAYAKECVATFRTKEPERWLKCDMRGRGELQIHDGGGRRNAAGGYGKIYLPRWSRTRLVIMHEVAHCLAGVSVHHCWEYADIYLALIKRMAGGKAWLEMVRAFRKGRVQFRDPALRKKRTLSPERKAKLAIILAAARAKRAAHKTQIVDLPIAASTQGGQ